MEPHSAFVEANDVRLHVLRWGDPGDRPPALLVAGTGFPGLTWRAVAEILTEDYVVYTFDRRGHGLSDKPPLHPSIRGLGYDFADFANDLIALIDALDLSGVYGIGHSSGGTDVLLAAGLRPDLFSRLFVFEPTIAHPAVDPPPPPSPEGATASSAAALRRAQFASAQEVFTRYGSRPPLDVWRASALWDYIQAGFEQLDGGRVRLLCTPELEAEMVVPIAAAISKNRVVDGLSDPFPAIEAIRCPVMLTTGERSGPQYRRMTEGAARAIPGAGLEQVPGSTHYIPMQLPAEFVARVRLFAELG